MRFTQDICLTEIDPHRTVIGDYPARSGERYRIAENAIGHPSSPGVSFSLIAMPSGGSVWSERLFIVPVAALASSSEGV